MRTWLCGAAIVLLAVLATTTLTGQRGGVFRESRDHPAIRYSDGPRHDVVTALGRAVQAGEVVLAFEPTTGYLHAVLEALDVPVESQLTVFSKTSFQAHRINPENPRAIYFNDTVAVGWVRGGEVLEVASLDPTQGVLFFSIDQTPTDRPEIRRNDQCLACHLAWDTLAVPGLLTFSTLPMPDDPNAYAVGWVTDHRSPLAERWGSWYVTGAPPSVRHLGNTTDPIEYVPGASLDPAPALDTLEGLFDLTGYPTPYSDLVALLVLEHRTHMTNLLVRMGWETRVADYEDTRAGQPPDSVAAAGIEDTAVEFVDYLLFVDEAPLPPGIRSTSGFGELFSAQGPFDRRDRSLHQLDLDGRLLRYPCSFLIYTDAFDALPERAKDAVYRRMWEVLSGQATADRYTRLTLDDRRAVVEILRDTKPDLPTYFQGTVR
ncbi:MAG: hypothetical protein IH939_07925 [Acidobacteria bacterium]|nr:hypothetical protein [Acidobacteriota bacterium]